MDELWDLLEQMDALTKTVQTEIASDRWAELARDERRRVARKLREAYLRIGNMLEEWQDIPEGTE